MKLQTLSNNSQADFLSSLKNGVHISKQGKNHVQGIAVDEKNGWIYWSFTTRLVKTDLRGNVVGSVQGLVGHLGCISLCPENGLVYGSLEFKKDSIGAGILKSLGNTGNYEDGFYIAVFDGAKITRTNMSAENDGIMSAAFLPEVLADYSGSGKDKNGKTVPHRFGCSGIDGVCFAPDAGSENGKLLCWVAYGVYSDLTRADNDHQVLLCFDPNELLKLSAPLSQTAMHRTGSASPYKKYFVFTGNTTYGVQNLEYSKKDRLLLMAVYRGKKPEYPNYDMFAVDLSKPARFTGLSGTGEKGDALTLFNAPSPESSEGISGFRFPYGQCGMQFLSGGELVCAAPVGEDGENAADLFAFSFDPKNGFEKI
ncbi:MAG: hypothetical protein IJS90_02185 [Clostridia bacterium]|nr:hypothetical protein [Clostridia bacterium]